MKYRLLEKEDTGDITQIELMNCCSLTACQNSFSIFFCNQEELEPVHYSLELTASILVCSPLEKLLRAMECKKK